ncbi:MAG: fatty acid desaturase, partial [Pontiella sp.]|nr:fatty acid desaturase [Pontiella sp.]
MNEESTNEPISRQALNKIIQKYTTPVRGKAVWQITNTLIPYAALWAAAILLIRNGYSLWWVLIPIVIAAPFLVRIFVIFHDCCHSSYFKSKWANSITGYLGGILTFTPFVDWQQAHIHHHATAGNLDKRGVGDI